MYPSGELNALTARKIMLRARIAERRLQCSAAALEVARPISWVDEIIARWRRIPPLAKIVGAPLGLLLRRKIGRRFGGGGKLLPFAPLVFQAARIWRLSSIK
jgi:hypothetical protein